MIPDKLNMKGFNDLSSLVRSKIFFNAFTANLIIHDPIIQTAIAPRSFGPNPKIND